jgi:tRNA (mo5U34)-methyltransferase
MAERPVAHSAAHELDAVAGFSSWYHRITLPAGTVTPGVHDSPTVLAHLDSLGLPADCRGLRVLDVGCRDGFFTFALERRGATVVAIDYLPPTATGFSIASGLIGSKSEYLTVNVYDLNPDTHGRFDLVVFLGVLYHLRNPMIAIDAIRSVMKPGAKIFVESQVIDEAFRLCDGSFQPLSILAPALLNSPVIQLHPGRSLADDPTNSFSPNMVALRAMFEESEFEVTRSLLNGSRGYITARAVDDPLAARWRDLDGSAGAN